MLAWLERGRVFITEELQCCLRENGHHRNRNDNCRCKSLFSAFGSRKLTIIPPHAVDHKTPNIEPHYHGCP